MMFRDTELQMAAQWANKLTGQGEPAATLFSWIDGLPFSFVFGDKQSSELLPEWKMETQVPTVDGQRTTHTVTYTDAVTGLQVRIDAVVFGDFPAVEWVMYLKNTGSGDTPIIESIKPLDASFQSPGRVPSVFYTSDSSFAIPGGNPVVHYAKGSVCSPDDYMPLKRVIEPGTELRLQAGGGRSSSDFLPFFNIETSSGAGVILSIGWSGEWAVDFRGDKPSGDTQVIAGMDHTHLRLHPNEEIRTPLMLTIFWEGDRVRSHNMLRRFILAHHSPRPNGKMIEMPAFDGNWGDTPAEDHLRNIQAAAEHEFPIEYYWIDAQWFGEGDWPRNPGNWNVKKDRYPQGFKPISDALHENGRKLLLWFEPERVCEGTPWHNEHREWLLEVPADKQVLYDWKASRADPGWIELESKRNLLFEGDSLFNLAIPEARQFLTDFISDKIDEFGLDCYRHDANISTLEYWRAADRPDRQGMTEIRWIEGLYEFWGELLRRHPGLIIDNCASGGRRIDIESLSLSTPFWRTDFPAGSVAKQCHTLGLLPWVPLNATGDVCLWRDGFYQLRSTMSSSTQFALFDVDYATWRVKPIPDDYPWDKAKRMLQEYQETKRYFLGDYYPLTEYSQADDAWIVYQLDLPESGEGLVVVLKRELSSLNAGAFHLRALDGDAEYEISNRDTGAVQRVSGACLMWQGMDIELREQPASALITYRRL